MLMPFRKRKDLLEAIFDDEMPRDFLPFHYFPRLPNMRADIKEYDDEFVIEAELPGFKKEEISIELNDNTLTISAVLQEEINQEGGKWVHRERRQGNIQRTFYVDQVDNNRVSAEFQNGILTVTLPKLKEPEAGSQRIDIK